MRLHTDCPDMISDDATEVDKAEFDRAISLIQSAFSNHTVTGDPALVREVMDLATNIDATLGVG